MVMCGDCKWLVSSPSGFYFCLQQEDTNEDGENIIMELPITIVEHNDPCISFEEAI